MFFTLYAIDGRFFFRFAPSAKTVTSFAMTSCHDVSHLFDTYPAFYEVDQIVSLA